MRPKDEGTSADTSAYSVRDRFWLWLLYEARLTRSWAWKVTVWWGYNIRHYPEPPPWLDDPVAQALGFVPMKDAGRELLERQRKREDET